MATVADLIAAALTELGILAAGESVSAADQSAAFASLNRMLDSWANERLMLYGTVRNSYTLTPSLNPHTIGTEGSPSLNATRPVRIDRASIILTSSPNSELPLSIVDDAAWQITQGKTTTGTPVFLWVENSFPLAKLWLNPVPVAADNLILYTWQQISRFAATAATVDLPPGYEDAIVYGLAKRLAPSFGVQLSPELAETANEAKAGIKRINTQPNYMRSDAALLRPGPFNLISGDKG